MPEDSRTALVGRTAVIAVYLVALLAAPGPLAVPLVVLLGVIWLAAYARDTARARSSTASIGAVDGC